jgi:hypothetical protein
MTLRRGLSLKNAVRQGAADHVAGDVPGKPVTRQEQQRGESAPTRSHYSGFRR